MALTSYTTLKASIANWLNRSDLSDEIADDFIVLTEADFNSKLRVRKMIAQTSFTIDSETEALPTGFLQVRDIYILSGSTKYPLRYMTPPQMDQVRGTSRTGLPLAYTILGDTFRFMPKPDSSYTAYINYYKSFDALSDTNTSNYILTNEKFSNLFPKSKKLLFVKNVLVSVAKLTNLFYPNSINEEFDNNIIPEIRKKKFKKIKFGSNVL